MKLYQVCEAESGWVCGFDIYTGTTECANYAEAVSDSPMTQTTRIVVGLLAYCGLLDNGHTVYMDSYYSSPELYDLLELHGTYACGTLRKNRAQVPEAIKQIKCKEGEGIFRRRGNLLALKFRDKRDIHMLSTKHDAKMSEITNRRGHIIRKPQLMIEYVNKMGGVDLSDQLQQYYGLFRKTRKYWKKLFFYLFNLIITNSYILHKKFTENKLSQYDFRLSLVHSFLSEAENAPTPAKRGRKSTGDIPRRLTERHFPSFIPAAPGSSRKHGLRDCSACNVPANRRLGFKRKQSSFQCVECNRTLCVPDCFNAYHTLQNYRTALRINSEP